MRTFRTLILLVSLSLLSLIVNSQTLGNIKFIFTTTSPGGVYAPRHVLAVWVEDSSGNFVRTIKLRANTQKKHLYTWIAKSNYNVTDAITGATINSHETHTLFWDTKDNTGNIVADGDYTFFIEFTSNNAQGTVASVSFTKDSTEQNLSPPNQSNVKNISIAYKLGVSVPEIKNLKQETKIQTLPNPFSDKIHISYKFKKSEKYSLKITDIKGKLLKESKGFGQQINYYWDGTNQSGSSLPKGVYFISIESKNEKAVMKIIKY